MVYFYLWNPAWPELKVHPFRKCWILRDLWIQPNNTSCTFRSLRFLWTAKEVLMCTQTCEKSWFFRFAKGTFSLLGTQAEFDKFPWHPFLMIDGFCQRLFFHYRYSFQGFWFFYGDLSSNLTKSGLSSYIWLAIRTQGSYLSANTTRVRFWLLFY